MSDDTNAPESAEETPCTDTIVQMLTVPPEWTVLCEDANGLVSTHPILCLALVECDEHGDQAIVPMVAKDDEIIQATALDNYAGVYLITMEPDDEDGELSPSFVQ
jgi:CelD/BcsL family acetyltransferase involved in cellulose biosynthesis